jgi:glucokinase
LDTAAQGGDGVAKSVWEAVGDEVGAALASAVWVLNPDYHRHRRWVAKAGDLVLDPIRRSVRARTMELFHKNLRIVGAELGNDAGVIGNAELVLDAAG